MRFSRTTAGAVTVFGANHRYRLVCFLAAVSLILVSSTFLFSGRTSSSGTNTASTARAGLSNAASIQAAGRGKPWINMTDGHELLTAYEGSDEAVRTMSREQGHPMSLATADFDEDGMPDLIAGYATAKGGIIVLHRGNVDSVYPNTPSAKHRKAEGTFSEVPFLEPARIFETTVPPDFVEVGDFDADGHQDLVLASLGDNLISFMPGDGSGHFRLPEAIVLPGRVAALASGDVNRADGLVDLVVAVSGNQSSKLLVFESLRGAIRAVPEALDLPSEASAIKIGYLTDAPEADIAVAAGSELLIVHGRDRKLFLSAHERIGIPDPQITRRDFPTKLTSLAIGDFTGDLKLDLAVALEDGTVQIMSDMKPRRSALQSAHQAEDWTVETLATNLGTGGAKLICARLSALSHETLIMADSANHRLQVWMDDAERRKRGDVTLKAAIGEPEKPVVFEVDGEPLAMVPMRLNMDGLSDLVILRSGHSSISVVRSVSSVIPVCTPQDCNNCGSLRDAITAANGTGGGNIVTFQSGAFNQVTTITLDPQLGTLPPITKALTIDGAQEGNVSCGGTAQDAGPADITPQALTAVQLTSSNNAASAISIQSGGCVLRNFVINRCQNGVQVSNSRGSFVEGNLVGTDPSGTQTRSNTVRGLFINNSGANTIGGTVSAASNFITGNALGVEISGGNATDNLLRMNFIGVTADNFAVGNGNGNGVSITNGASHNAVGGNIQFTGNLIAGNVDGVAIISGTSNTVQRNTFDLNRGNGATINSSGNTIGGTPQGVSVTNGFFRGGKNGVEINGGGATNNLVQGNAIGINFDSSSNPIDRHNAQHGIFITNNASGNFLGGSADVNLGNFIAFNLGAGVSILSGTGNRILINSIFSNTGLGIDLGNDGRDTNDDKDPDSGANDKQNFPVLVSAAISAAASASFATESPSAVVTIRVTLNSTPNQSFAINFYRCSNPCSSAGDEFISCVPQFLGTQTVMTGGDGNFSGDFPFDLGATVNSGFVNASATNSANGDTSEFSSCLQIGTLSSCAPICPTSPPPVQASSPSGAIVTYQGATLPTNCAGVTVGCAPASGSPFPVGTTTVTCTASDASGTRGTCSFQVTVTPPALADFSLGFAQSTVTGQSGAKARITVTINRTGGFAGAVTVTPAPKSAGVKPKPPDPIETTESTATFKYKIAEGTEPGPRQLTFTGTDASGRVRTATATLIVQ